MDIGAKYSLVNAYLFFLESLLSVTWQKIIIYKLHTHGSQPTHPELELIQGGTDIGMRVLIIVA